VRRQWEGEEGKPAGLEYLLMAVEELDSQLALALLGGNFLVIALLLPLELRALIRVALQSGTVVTIAQWTDE
jgi:hypothetical protein